MDREREKYEKEVLGNTLHELFFEMESEAERRFADLKEKYLGSISESEKDIFIETIIVEKEEMHKFLRTYFPVVKSEGGRKAEVENGFYLEEVYLDMSYDEIGNVLENEYGAFININNETYEMKVILEYDTRYIDKIKRLHRSFILNGKEWRTLNMAHFKRMYRIRVVSYDFNMTREIYEEIRKNSDSITYDFEGYEESVLKGKVLLWNVEERKIISSIFIRPIRNDISFEYIIRTEGEMLLAENTQENDILCCYMDKGGELHIISKRKAESIWNTFSVKSREECKKTFLINEIDFEKMPEYFYFNNYRIESFIDRLHIRSCKGNMLRSRSFIEKEFSAYSFIRKEFRLKDVVLEGKVKGDIIFYDCNDFIEKDFHLFFNEKRIRLSLLVECNDRNKYTEDFLSFIISSIQYNIPEYRCEGYIYGE